MNWLSTNLNKYAQNADLIKTREVQSKISHKPHKEVFTFSISDIDRYVSDTYIVTLTLQETKNRYSIGFRIYNQQVGTTGLVQYWHYEKSEFKRAKKTYGKLKKILQKLMSDIDYSHPPMAIITPLVRYAIQSVDVGRKERSGNCFHNWFVQLSTAPDWRETIYGNRYPESSLQTIDFNWNKDEHSKEIITEGNSSRSKILKYKFK